MPRKPQRRHKKLPRQPAARGTLRLGLVLLVLVTVNLYVFLWRHGTSIPDVMQRAAVAGDKVGPGAAAADTAAGTSGAMDRDDDDDTGPGQPPAPGDETDGTPDEPGRWVDGTVGSGDSLGKILKREGLTPPEADELIRALGENLDMRAIRAGQSYRVHFDDAGRVMEFEYKMSRTRSVWARRGADGTMTSKKVDAETRIEKVELGGTIDSSLYASIKATGEDTKLVAFFVDVFAYDLNFYIDTRQGDTFRMIVEKEYLGDEFLRYGHVLAAEYSGQAGTFRAFYWKPPGEKQGRYFNDKGESVERTFLKTPLKYTRISSTFDRHRMHPILHIRRAHLGVDYAAPIGTPIWAAASGKIIFRGRRGGAGNCVMIRHDNGLVTEYMHMSKFRKGQNVGKRVHQKDVIGYVGMTGLATGPHLHFSIKKNGHFINPLKMKMARGEGVARHDRAKFEHDTHVWVRRLAAISTRTGTRTAVTGPDAADGDQGGAGPGVGASGGGPAAGAASKAP